MSPVSRSRIPLSLNQLKRRGNRQIKEAQVAAAESARLAEENRRVRVAIQDNHNHPLPFAATAAFMEPAETP